MTLRLRLMLSITAGLLVSLTIGAGLACWHAIDKVHTEIGAAIAVGTRIVENAVNTLDGAAEPQRQLARIVANFDGDRHLVARLVEASGRVVLTSTPLPPEDPVPDWFFGLLSGPSLTARIVPPGAFARFGIIELATDAHNELSEAWDDLGMALAVLAIFCVLALALVHWTLGRALGPLNDLNIAFARLGGGDYAARVGESGFRELTRVYQGFNRMVERLATVERHNQRLQEQLATVQEEERTELARDLHDEIGPFLFAVNVDASMIQRAIDGGARTPIAPHVEAIRDAVAHMQKHLRAILGRLRPAIPLDLGLGDAIDEFTRLWQARRPEVGFDVAVTALPGDDHLGAIIYRIVRESVSNALRHGHPDRIAIRVTAGPDGALCVEVADNGGGLPPGGRAGGYGIVGMQERVAALGGSLAVRNRDDGTGVVVSAKLPAAAAPRADMNAQAQGAVVK